MKTKDKVTLETRQVLAQIDKDLDDVRKLDRAMMEDHNINPSVFLRQSKEMDIDDLLARSEQAFKVRQFIHNREQREAIGDYGRDLVAQAVAKLEELNATE